MHMSSRNIVLNMKNFMMLLFEDEEKKQKGEDYSVNSKWNKCVALDKSKKEFYSQNSNNK